MIEQLVASIPDAIETGLPYIIGFLGVWLLFRVYHDFDLTVGGSFTLGGAIVTAGVAHVGVSPWTMLLVAALGGALAGAATLALHRLLRLGVILASIIVVTALISVNLVVMGLPNISVVDKPSIFDVFGALGFDEAVLEAVVLAGIVIMTLALVSLLLQSEFGLAFRAAGANKAMARAAGVSPESMLGIALVAGNALCAISGALVAEQQGFADVSMGNSLLILGITGVLLGEVVIRGRSTVAGLGTVVAGSFLYRYIVALAFRFGVPPEYFSALTAGIVAAAVGFNLVATRTRGTGSLVRVALRRFTSPDPSGATRP